MANVLQWNSSTNSFSVSGASSVTQVVGEGIDNNFSVPQTFGAGILQTGAAGTGNQSPLLNVGDAFSDFIASGVQWAIPSSASLTTSMTSGSAYLNSVRTLVPAISGNAFPASNDTYVSFNNSGVPAYQSVANGATAPTPESGYVQTAKVVTSPIVSPVPTLTTSSSGSLASGTYLGALVAHDATGYGAVSATASVTVAASGTMIFNWVNPLNETSMDIYATTAGSTTLGLVASGVTGTTYTYTGSVAPGAAAPTVATSNAIQSVTDLILMYPHIGPYYNIKSFGAIGDGITDDTAAIQYAVNQVLDGPLIVPSGTYVINSINIPSTCKGLVGTSTSGTVFSPSRYLLQNAPLLIINGAQNAAFGRFSISTPLTSNNVPFQINNGTDVEIFDIDCSESGGDSFYLYFGIRIKFHNNRAMNYGQQAILAQTCTDSKISGNYCASAVTANNAIQSISGTNNYFNDNISRTTSPNAVGFCISLFDENGSICDSNRLFPTGIEGINLQGSSNCVVSNNEIQCATGHHDFGLSVYAQSANCTNNVISNNTISNSGKAGIALASTAAASPNPAYDCTYHSIIANKIINPCQNQLAGEIHIGIVISGDVGATNNSVHSNDVTDTTGEMNYGVNELSGNNNIIGPNNINGTAIISNNTKLSSSLSKIYSYYVKEPAVAIGYTATAGNITAVASQIIGRYLFDTATQTAAFTITTDTAINILDAYPNANVGTSFVFRLFNNDQSATGYAATLAFGTGVSLNAGYPNPVVPRGGWNDYLFSFTAIGSSPTIIVTPVGGASTGALL